VAVAVETLRMKVGGRERLWQFPQKGRLLGEFRTTHPGLLRLKVLKEDRGRKGCEVTAIAPGKCQILYGGDTLNVVITE